MIKNYELYINIWRLWRGWNNETVSIAQRAEELLGAVCQQLWATMESDGNPEKAQPLQRDRNGKMREEPHLDLCCLKRMQHHATIFSIQPYSTLFNIIFLHRHFRTKFEMILSLILLTSSPNSRRTMTEKGSTHNYWYLHLLVVVSCWLERLQVLENQETTHILGI